MTAVAVLQMLPAALPDLRTGVVAVGRVVAMGLWHLSPLPLLAVLSQSKRRLPTALHRPQPRHQKPRFRRNSSSTTSNTSPSWSIPPSRASRPMPKFVVLVAAQGKVVALRYNLMTGESRQKI
jgi:hypothetical protein